MVRATRSSERHWYIHRALWLMLVLVLALLHRPALAAEPNGRGSYADLLALFKDVSAWTTDSGAGGPVDYRPAAIAARKAEIEAFHRRLADMGVAGWPREQKVDYLIVRAEVDKRDYVLNVTRPWARDPAFFVHALIEPTFIDLPATGEKLKALETHLASVPTTLAQARQTLTEATSDHADLAIFLLSNSDGVENQYPERAVAPAGAIGWHRDLLARADKQPALKPAIRRAIAAMEEYRDWLVANRSKMTARTGVGKESLDWYIKNVMLMPYTSDETITLSQRELDRMWAFYALERHRNKGLPEIALPTSAAEYEQRVARTDAKIRDWLVKSEFITIPDYIPTDWREMGFNVPWVKRATPPNFWEQIQYRDPSPDHFHAVIPGHRFDDRMRAANTHPIRGPVRFDGRWQGWAVYLEEAPLVAGFFENMGRERELIYLFGLWRAARSIGDMQNQRNVLTAEQSVDYWMEVTPLLDRAVARKYAYLRPLPGHGMEYTMGNIQMWALLAEAKRLRGDAFVLKDFHDEFMSKGQIPISLIRWEMTGNDADVKRFWERTPMPGKR
jgi:hypothetical protein